MHVDMTSILVGRSDKISFSFEWNGAFDLFPNLKFDKPIHIFGEVVNHSGYMQLYLKAEVSYISECARCLEKLHRKLLLGLEKNVVLKNDAAEENGDAVVISDSAVDLEEPSEELLFLELPSRDICKEDCLGLCIKCGKNLNYGKCNCSLKEIDPRLAVLRKFLDEDK